MGLVRSDLAVKATMVGMMVTVPEVTPHPERLPQVATVVHKANRKTADALY